MTKNMQVPEIIMEQKKNSIKQKAERIIDFLFGVSLPLNLYVARVNETTFIFSKEHLNG